VDNGHVIVDLDLSAQPSSLPDGYSTCTSGGMKYHIHKKWWHSSDTGLIGSTNCSSAYTGGHWDPWHGCGSASGNADCDTTVTSDDNTSSTCLPTSAYFADFDNDVFSAEVGDWNGKYGLIEVDSDDMMYRSDSSFFEVTPDDMFWGDYSVVFHCNGGDRAFCAPFVKSWNKTTMSIPAQNATATAVAYFDTVGNDSYAMFTPSGAVYISMASIIWHIFNWNFGANHGNTTGCPNFSYGIFNMNSTWDLDVASATGFDCYDYVGDFWDPTHQCMNFSDSPYCYDDGLCDDSGYSYDCTYDTDRYSCAPGDLSGKFGTMPDSSWAQYVDAGKPDDMIYTLNETGPNTLIPRTDDMVGKMLSFYCNNGGIIEHLACAPIYNISGDTTTTTAPTTSDMTTTTTDMSTTTATPDDTDDSMDDSGDGVVAQSVVVAVVASLFAMLF